MGRKILHYVQAGYPGLFVVSHEEQRIEAELKAVTDQLNLANKADYALCYWSVVDGLVNTKTKQVNNANDALEVLGAMRLLRIDGRGIGQTMNRHT